MVLAPALAWGQGSCVLFPAQLTTGTALTDASSYVCTKGTSTNSCLSGINTVAVFSDETLGPSFVLAQPIHADSTGNTYICAAPGTYTVCTTSPRANAYCWNQQFYAVSLQSPVLSVSPASMNYGTVTQGSQSPSQNVAITNVGGGTLTVTSVAISGANASDFGVPSPGAISQCNTTLAGGAICSLPIAFTPSTTAAESATLTVSSPDSFVSNTVALLGTGTGSTTFNVGLTMAGTGNGSVTSGETPPNLNCQWANFSQTGQCGFGYASGASVTLAANPVSPATFAGWGGDGTCTGLSLTCTFTVNAAVNVTANFNNPASDSALTITGTGQGSGNVVSDVGTATGTGQLNCNINAGVASSGGGAGCSGPFVTGTTITLTESAQSGSVFNGWTPASICTNDPTGASATCVLTLNADTTVTANFGSSAIPLALQQTAACNANTASQINCVWNLAQKAGDFIVCGFNWSDATTTVSSVTDTKSNTYSVGKALAALTDISQVVYYAPNIAAAAAGANTTTVALSANATNRNGRCLEYAGVVTSTPIDQTAGATGTSASPASGATAATTQGNDLVTGFVAADANVSTASTGFTQQILQNNSGGNTWAVVQATSVTSCSSGSSTCALSWSKATGAGHVLVIAVQFPDNTTTVSSISGGGTFTDNVANIYDSNTGKSVNSNYTTNSTSGVSSSTITASASPANTWRVAGVELSYSGASLAFDASASQFDSSCTTCAGAALTLTGTNDAIVQNFTTGALISSISSPYTLQNGSGLVLGQGTSLNTSSGTAPNITLSAAGNAGVSAVSFKGTGAGVGADAEDIQGIASGSTPNFQPKLTASANWVAQEVAWKAQQTNPSGTNVSITIVGSSVGTGNGTVTSNIGNPPLNCTVTPTGTSGTCSSSVSSGSTVQLNATPSTNPNSVFVAWFGVNGCGTSPTCQDSVGTSSQTVTAQFNVVTSTFTLGLQEPVSTVPYPNSMFNSSKTLPNAGSGGPTAHLAANSDAMIAQEFTYASQGGSIGPGWFGWSSPGNQDQEVQRYYGNYSAGCSLGTPTCDATYVLTGCSSVAGGTFNPLNIPFHVSGAGITLPPGASSDHFLSIWDQTDNNTFSFYTQGSGGSTVFPACPGTTGHAGTPADPCPVNNIMKCALGNWTMASPVLTAQGGQAGNSTGFLQPVGVIRMQELVSGQINHPIYLNTVCSSGTFVFPNVAGNVAQVCSNIGLSNTNALPNGSLIFFDYTNAQLADMCPLPICSPAGAHAISVWQYPIIKALTYYGGYFGDTSGQTSGGIMPSRAEAGDAYHLLNISSPHGGSYSGPDAFFQWLSSNQVAGSACSTGTAPNSVFHCNLPTFANLPLEGGTGYQSHMHVADQCVAKTLAGVSGGC